MTSYLGENLDSLTQNVVTGFSGLVMGTNKASSVEEAPVRREEALTFCSFNQDATSLTVGTHSGYKMFTLNSSDTLDFLHENSSAEVVLAERLFSSSLIAVVDRSSPRRLSVRHFKRGTEICGTLFSNKILSVKLNRARLVVCLEESLYIHNIQDMSLLHVIRDTPPNRRGLCALSKDADRAYLAYPGHSNVGELQIFDVIHLSAKRTIAAHNSQLSAVAFSPCGRQVATASEKGTVIRVFSVDDGSRLYELRRGLKRTVDIYSLSFSPCGQFLACSSNTETVHVFKLEEKPKDSEVIVSQSPQSQNGVGSGSNCNESWFGYLNTMVSTSASRYLPTQVTDTLLQGRAFATVHHSQPGMKNVCALAVIKRTLRLLLASADGFLYLYALNLEEGGPCSLIKQFRLTDQDMSQSGRQDEGHIPQREADLKVQVSYADRVKNRENGEMTADSEKFLEMEAATETPPKQCFLLDDDGEFPPMVPTVQ